MLIRRELPTDRQAVLDIHRQAFGAGNSEVVEARLLEELREDGDLIPQLCFLALISERPVGHLAISRGQLESRQPAPSAGPARIKGGFRVPSLGLGPLGVLPQFQGRGVGSALMHAAIGATEALGASELLLLGSPSYYSRFGFRAASAVQIASVHPEWGEHFQIRTLSAWAGDSGGTFHYAPAFERLGSRPDR
jgi:putative acetyltransferase